MNGLVTIRADEYDDLQRKASEYASVVSARDRALRRVGQLETQIVTLQQRGLILEAQAQIIKRRFDELGIDSNTAPTFVTEKMYDPEFDALHPAAINPAEQERIARSRVELQSLVEGHMRSIHAE